MQVHKLGTYISLVLSGSSNANGKWQRAPDLHIGDGCPSPLPFQKLAILKIPSPRYSQGHLIRDDFGVYAPSRSAKEDKRTYQMRRIRTNSAQSFANSAGDSPSHSSPPRTTDPLPEGANLLLRPGTPGKALQESVADPAREYLKRQRRRSGLTPLIMELSSLKARLSRLIDWT